MEKLIFCLVVAVALSVTQLQAQASKRLLGTWVSYNRADTITLQFINDSIFYFHLSSPSNFNDSAFKFWTYRIDTQYMMIATPPHSIDLRYYLWFLSVDEVKLQLVRPGDYDNPVANIPAETEVNTVRLKSATKKTPD
jgi:hypothetical protein